MSLLRAFRRPAPARVEPRLAPAPAERRDAGLGLGAVSLAPFGAAAGFSARAAENLSGVIACVNAISSALASVPARIYRTTDAGRVELPRHPVARLIQVGRARN